MPTSLFLGLNTEKQQKIFTAGVSEFADYGYDNSSTNRIVKRAGISKGSLFQYFPTKEDFYFYVLDEIAAELTSALDEKVNTLSSDLFQRIIEYAALEFSWHILYPEKSKMIIRAFTKSDTDGLTTVKGKAVVFAVMYRIYAKEYTVYVFSRKNHLQEGYSTREMAKDHAKAMTTLGIEKADILGISQGGMIAQYLAIDHPDLVNKLILAVTSAKPNETIKKVVGAWMELVILGKPKSPKRFLIQAASCVSHNADEELKKIICPTFVIGGDCDKIVGVASASAIADKISGSELFIYNGLGHAAYEEAKDFNERVLNFFVR